MSLGLLESVPTLPTSPPRCREQSLVKVPVENFETVPGTWIVLQKGQDILYFTCY